MIYVPLMFALHLLFPVTSMKMCKNLDSLISS